MTNDKLTYEEACRLLRYDSVRIYGKVYKSHRIAWLLFYGCWPKNEIDHIDGNGLNNRITNLRDVNRHENMRNTRKTKRSVSGVCGVTFSKQRNKWRARISIDNKEVNLGEYRDKLDAIKARRIAENNIKDAPKRRKL